MTAAERRATIKRLERWFTLARQYEKLTNPWPTTHAAHRRLDRFQKLHPHGGVINAVFLYDLFMLALNNEAKP